jgi:hypothetical protein
MISKISKIDSPISDGYNHGMIQIMFIELNQPSDSDSINPGNHLPFVGSKGEIGLAPVESVFGDEVWYTIGCDTVIVLRRHENGYYEVVGEGYSEGYNLGELNPLVTDEIGIGNKIHDFTVEEIVLR